MAESVRAFYDVLAADYHLIFADWETSGRRQSAVLATLIANEVGPGLHAILDCACGIGTQTLGLAALGHRVHATDFSPLAVARAAREATARGLTATFGVADLLTLTDEVPGTFDVVLACDNVLPHFLSDEALARAAGNMAAKLRVGGLLLTSLRDYDRLARERPSSEGPRIVADAGGRRISFQVWDWADDGTTYTLHQYITRQEGEAWRTIHAAASYRALRRAELESALHAAGLKEIHWHDPAACGYYQPLVTARKP